MIRCIRILNSSLNVFRPWWLHWFWVLALLFLNFSPHLCPSPHRPPWGSFGRTWTVSLRVTRSFHFLPILRFMLDQGISHGMLNEKFGSNESVSTCSMATFLDAQTSLEPILRLVNPFVCPTITLSDFLSVRISEPSQSVEMTLWWPRGSTS